MADAFNFKNYSTAHIVILASYTLWYAADEQIWTKYFTMQDLRFGPTFTFPTSGLLTTPAVKRIRLCSTRGKGVGALGMLREFEYRVWSLSVN